jgi:ABC-2 type transport system ATP-binding protein
MSASAIEILNLTKTYPKQRGVSAVKSLSLRVPNGSIYGFLGANGAGKTTCIKILLGLQFATSGTVKIFGQDPALHEVKQRIGFLPERPYFHDSMGAEEFLNFHRSLFPPADAGHPRLTNRQLLELVGLRGAEGKSLKQFSKGMLQRAGIAQTLVNNPDLIILDEPMSGLDPVGRREVRDIILRLRGEGKTIFMSSHILSDIEQLCDRVAFLEKGVLRREGAIQELLVSTQAGYEITLAGPEAAWRSIGGSPLIHAQGATFSCQTAEEAQKLIERAWAAGSTLLSYVPRQKRLEEVLFGEQGL